MNPASRGGNWRNKVLRISSFGRRALVSGYLLRMDICVYGEVAASSSSNSSTSAIVRELDASSASCGSTSQRERGTWVLSKQLQGIVAGAIASAHYPDSLKSRKSPSSPAAEEVVQGLVTNNLRAWFPECRTCVWYLLPETRAENRLL